MKMNKLDVIHRLFVSPAAVIRGVSLGKHLNLALFVATLSVISTSIGELLLLQQNIAPSLFITTLLIRAVFLFLLLFVLCGVLSMVAGFYGGVGNGRFLYVAACLSLIPYWLVTPAALLISYFELGALSSYLLFSLFRMVIFFWAAGLFVISIRETYVFSHGKAIATILTPVIVAWVLLIVLFILLISIIGPLMGELFAYLP